jgi:aspartate racemase
MPTLGMVGGIGPESTIEYYRFIVAAYRERMNGAYPELMINSIDLKHMLELCAEKKWAELVTMLSEGVEQLARAGATFGVLASNTPHIVFDDVAAKSPIPLISIVEAAARDAKRLGFRRLALFGTKFTMQGGFYEGVFRRNEMEIVRPTAAEQDFIHDKYMNELLANRFLPETRDAFLTIVGRTHEEERIDAVILGGTELPLIMRGAVSPVPFIDTTKVHVAEILERLTPQSATR